MSTSLMVAFSDPTSDEPLSESSPDPELSSLLAPRFSETVGTLPGCFPPVVLLGGAVQEGIVGLMMTGRL